MNKVKESRTRVRLIKAVAIDGIGELIPEGQELLVSPERQGFVVTTWKNKPVTISETSLEVVESRNSPSRAV